MKLQKVEEENIKVEGDIQRRHDRYILRETEYRNTIDDLQRELRVRNGYEKDADLKNKQVIGLLDNQLKKSIENIMPKKEQLCQEQEKDIIRKFNSELIKMKKKLEEQKSYKSDQAADLKERENEM